METAKPFEALTDTMKETIRSAARRLTGFARRQFQAEVAIQYCDGSARKAERLFGWSRSTVNTGLCEKRTGLRCVDAFQLRGRKKSKVAAPQRAQEVCIHEGTGTHADSTLQSVVASVGKSAVRAGAGQIGIDTEPADVSSRGSKGLILSRVGNRLRRALKNRFKNK